MSPRGLARRLRGDGWHLPLLVAVSALYERVFLHHWINFTDEGWPLYAATRLLQGGVLYQDVFFVFPPGHLLPAWIGAALDPPGVVLARGIYAAFNVALCAAIYLLGRRLMPARWAFFGALLLALAAPFSHRAQLLFGYRYLVWSVLALLAFAERLRSGDTRWMLVAGALAGTALCFRLTPAFAVSVGIGVGALVAQRSLREPLLDGLRYGLGAALVVLPVVAWLAAQVGLATLWREVVVRPVLMTELQSLPVPDLFLPTTGDRIDVHDAWVALLFRIVPLVYAGYALVLGVLWLRARRGGEGFPHALLAAVVAWGAVYYVRSLGRSDEPHLSSAIPPFCLLLAHLLWTGLRALGASRWRRPAALAAAFGLFAIWIWAPGVDRYLDAEFRGTTPYAPLDGRVRLREDDRALETAPMLRQIQELAAPDATILDMSAEPLLYVMSGRRGPGHFDVVMPGTFRDAEEEREFLARLRRSPPELVVVPGRPFDNEPSRALWRSAPQTIDWVSRHYSLVSEDPARYLLLQRLPRREFPAP